MLKDKTITLVSCHGKQSGESFCFQGLIVSGLSHVLIKSYPLISSTVTLSLMCAHLISSHNNLSRSASQPHLRNQKCKSLVLSKGQQGQWSRWYPHGGSKMCQCGISIRPPEPHLPYLRRKRSARWPQGCGKDLTAATTVVCLFHRESYHHGHSQPLPPCGRRATLQNTLDFLLLEAQCVRSSCFNSTRNA